ncbi:MAG: hypothetical protein Q8Q18_02075 [bacterium]|nr:hypothetical protein [bacterium]
MPRRLQLKEGNYYHIKNYGADNRQVFRTNSDRSRFTQLLFLCNSKKSVIVRDVRDKRNLFSRERDEHLTDIGAFVLMPDSFELVVYDRIQGGTSRFMQKLLTGYSMYFNHQYGRAGRLFAGSYQAKELKDDESIQRAVVAMHLTPLSRVTPNWREEGIEDLQTAKQYLEQYPHSSYFDYCRIQRPQGAIINLEPFAKACTPLGTDCFMAHIGAWFDARNAYTIPN